MLLFEGGAKAKRSLFDYFELFGEGNAGEAAVLECSLADSFEVFVEDDELEGSAFAERLIFDKFELIGESDTREGGAILKCVFS